MYTCEFWQMQSCTHQIQLYHLSHNFLTISPSQPLSCSRPLYPAGVSTFCKGRYREYLKCHGLCTLSRLRNPAVAPNQWETIPKGTSMAVFQGNHFWTLTFEFCIVPMGLEMLFWLFSTILECKNHSWPIGRTQTQKAGFGSEIVACCPVSSVT